MLLSTSQQFAAIEVKSIPLNIYALLYAWGDSKLSKVIITVDGNDKGVTLNCKFAMEELLCS
jgi:hypothetical protein